MKAKINKKWLIITVALLVGICGGIYLTSQDRSNKIGVLTKNPYFVPLKINGYSSANIPYFTVRIEDKVVTAKIDLGCDGYISLPATIMKKLNKKKFLRSHFSYGLKGKTYESCVYEVPKIHIENMAFFPVPAEETNLEFEKDTCLATKEETCELDLGRVGWRLFRNFNLLIDCKNSTLALCDSLKTLKEQGYPVDFFTETSLLLDGDFIEFQAQTEHGMLRCTLDSGSTWNMLNMDLENPSNSHMLFSSKNIEQHSVLNPENKNLLSFDAKHVRDISVFTIGGQEFGPMTFNHIKSPMALEAIMGMEFFEDTLIYIDFLNKKIYFYEYPEEKKLRPLLKDQSPFKVAA